MATDTTQPGRLVYTIQEAGALLGLCRNSAYDAARRGELPTIRIGRRLLVPKAAIAQMMAAGQGATTGKAA
ncbi:MAG: helix-turn-helix domain-containing protein [Alphaproteobacteria bacterium]